MKSKLGKRLLAFCLAGCLCATVLTSFTVSAAVNNNSRYIAREINDEGIVLLKNDNSALPLETGAGVALFGTAQAINFNVSLDSLVDQPGYIPYGAGSVKVLDSSEQIGPLDAFRRLASKGKVSLYEPLSQGYETVVNNETLDSTRGFRNHADFLPGDAMIASAAAAADTAVVFIRRWGGECFDLDASAWSLSSAEKSLLQKVSANFERVVVVLNTGSPMDTSWAFDGNSDNIHVDALLWVGYGGIQGGLSIADIIMGSVNPSGKLVTTYAKSLSDYPTANDFGGKVAEYTEDIYLGYRYFETVSGAKDKVAFPFGFGLSYTTFTTETTSVTRSGDTVTVKAKVTNTGDRAGKEVVQVYFSAPQGVLGKPARELCAFGKTQLLEPDQSETLTLTFNVSDMASYDDTGATGHKSAYVLEAGDYDVYVGSSVRAAVKAGSVKIESLTVTEQLTEHCTPTALTKRMRSDGTYETISVTPTEEPEEPAPADDSVLVDGATVIQGIDYDEIAVCATQNKAAKLYNPFTGVYEDYKYIDLVCDTWKSGSYVVYKLNVAQAGNYKMVARVAASGLSGSRTINYELSGDGTTYGAKNPITVPDTAVESGFTGSHNYKDVSGGTVALSEGVQYVRFTFASGYGINLAQFALIPEDDSFVLGFAQINAGDFSAINGCNYQPGKNGFVYNSATASWSAGTFNVIGNTYVGGSYVTYPITVPESGYYKLKFRAATYGVNTISVAVSSNGGTTYGTPVSTTIPNTYEAGGNLSTYHSYMDVVSENRLLLPAGEVLLKVTFSGAPNLNLIQLSFDEAAEVETYEEPPVKDHYDQFSDVIEGSVTMEDFVAQMTTTELAEFCVLHSPKHTGVTAATQSKYGIKNARLENGPCGLSIGTSFPSSTVQACTWNLELSGLFGTLVALECYDNGIDIWEAPAVNLQRSPLSGRSCEYYSEDPFISGKFAAAAINGAQALGIGTCLKHFVGNEQETWKTTGDTVLSERALRELYLEPFRIAMEEAHPWSVMSSYNKVNGTFAPENKELLTDILRGEWGFDGFVVADWNGEARLIPEINAGNNFQPHTTGNQAELDILMVRDAIRSGEITREQAEQNAMDILSVIAKTQVMARSLTICGGVHDYVDHLCTKCHRVDPLYVAAVNAALTAEYDTEPIVGYDITVGNAATVNSGWGTILSGSKYLNAEHTLASLTIANTMESKAGLYLMMGLYVDDTVNGAAAWTRVTGLKEGTQRFDSADSEVAVSGGQWIYIPYGCTATVYQDLSDAKYDTFVSPGSGLTFTREDYKVLMYLHSDSCVNGDKFITSNGISSGGTLTASPVKADPDETFSVCSVAAQLVEDGTVSAMPDGAGVRVSDGNPFTNKNAADTFVAKATENADYLFLGWYDADGTLLSTNPLCRYAVEAGKAPQTLYARYTNDEIEDVPHEGGSLYITGRGSRCSGPAQYMDLENGKYHFGAWFRFLDPTDDFEERKVDVNIGITGFYDNNGVKTQTWINTKSITVNDTEWHYIEDDITINLKDFTGADFYIQTVYAGHAGDAYAYRGDMEWDGFTLNKYSGDRYGVNIIKNPTCECDRFGRTEYWRTTGALTMSNTACPIDYTCVDNGDGTLTYTYGFVPVTDANIRYMGRWVEGTNRVQAGFESNLSLAFTGSVIGINGNGGIYYDIDYGTPQYVQLTNDWALLGEELDDGEHLLRVYTPGQQYRPTVTGFVIDAGESTVAQEAAKKIEFIGDSIMEGYCDAGNNNTLCSYGTILGQRLNEENGFDFNVIAFGGSGVVHTGSDPLPMPERYKLVREANNKTDSTADAWDTSRYVPDYIVINLGTNDEAENAQNTFTAEEFKEAYTDFITYLQGEYDGVKIFVMTPFNGTRRTEITALVTDLNDPDVILIDSAAWGIEAPDTKHPPVDVRDDIADLLYDAIEDTLFPPIMGVQLTVSDSLTLNFFTRRQGTLVVTRGASTVELTGVYDGSAKAYKFVYDGITPQCMNDVLTAELKVDNVTVDSLTYSVKEYCSRIVGKSAAALGYSEERFASLKTLLADMLDYGAAAQAYRQYNAENPANTEAWVAENRSTFSVPASCRSISASADAGKSIYSVSVRLSDLVQLYFRFDVDDWTNVSVKVSRNDGAAVTYTQADLIEHVLYLDGMLATDFADEYTVKLMQGEQVLQTAKYSVNSYVASKYDGANADLVKALGRYGASAASFVKNA